MLQLRVDRLNKLTGHALTSYTKHEDGKFLPNPGVYYIDMAYGGYQLEQMAEHDTGCSVVLSRGTKRELFDKLCAYINGIEVGQAIK